MTIQIMLLLCWLVVERLLPGVAGQTTCSWSGFEGCECTFIGACAPGTPTPKPNSGKKDREKMSGYAPRGLDQFRDIQDVRSPVNLAYLCEGNTVAVLYDCNARIPLYAATAMTGEQINADYNRPGKHFRKSSDPLLDMHFQQAKSDYKTAKSRNMCYEQRYTGNYFVDGNWWRAAIPEDTPLSTQEPCTEKYKSTKSPVHQGHLIAASYGRGDYDKIRETFVYTNAVPQFAVFNGGQWLSGEKHLIKWGRSNCNNHKGAPTENVRMYIVVGAIPSTYGNLKKRFFGESGFSDYEGQSTRDDTFGFATGKKSYRVNVPHFMWSAACCKFEYVEKRGSKKIRKEGTRSTAFYRENEPGRQSLNAPGRMVGLFKTMLPLAVNSLLAIDLFPAAHHDCYDGENFVILGE